MSKTNQNIETPAEFVKAVEIFFGISFLWDLAATSSNKKAPLHMDKEMNALSHQWPIGKNAWCWLNPPFGSPNLTPWVNKCSEQTKEGCKIISVWPLSADDNQVKAWKEATVYVITGRVWPEVRGLMLCRWGKLECEPADVRGLRWNKKDSTLLRIW
jgi:hypothetical protein